MIVVIHLCKMTSRTPVSFLIRSRFLNYGFNINTVSYIYVSWNCYIFNFMFTVFGPRLPPSFRPLGLTFLILSYLFVVLRVNILPHISNEKFIQVFSSSSFHSYTKFYIYISFFTKSNIPDKVN